MNGLSEEQIKREIADSDEWAPPPPGRLMRGLWILVLMGGAIALVVSVAWVVMT